MIEKSVLTYLLSIPAVNTITGGKIFYRRAPKTAVLPWVLITNSGGMRKRMTLATTGRMIAEDTLTIYVESADQFKGRDIAERILVALENYRGDMGDEQDLWVRMGSIRDLDGWNGTFRFLLTCYVEYTKPATIAG